MLEVVVFSMGGSLLLDGESTVAEVAASGDGGTLVGFSSMVSFRLGFVVDIDLSNPLSTSCFVALLLASNDQSLE